MRPEYLSYVLPAHRSDTFLNPCLHQALGHPALAPLYRKRKHRWNVSQVNPFRCLKGELPCSLVKAQGTARRGARLLAIYDLKAPHTSTISSR